MGLKRVEDEYIKYATNVQLRQSSNQIENQWT